MDEILWMEFSHKNGHRITPFCIGLDMGHRPDIFYNYLRDRNYLGCKIIGLKGDGDQVRQNVISTIPSFKNEGKVPIFYVSRPIGLNMLYSDLQIEESGPGYCHFPDFYENPDLKYFEQLNAFTRVIEYKKNGERVAKWHKKPSVRKEAGDCRRYATAALHHALVLGADIELFAERFNKYTPEQLKEILEAEENQR
ncbi:MAG: terminase gpA endonuclease subunit [Oligoflexales bacterium]